MQKQKRVSGVTQRHDSQLAIERRRCHFEHQSRHWQDRPGSSQPIVDQIGQIEPSLVTKTLRENVTIFTFQKKICENF